MTTPDVRRRRTPLRTLRLRLERARVSDAIAELSGLADVPHDIGDVARARIERLTRRERALARLIG